MAHYHFDRLSREHRVIYLNMIDAISKHSPKIVVWDKNFNTKDGLKIFQAVCYDHPELFYADLTKLHMTNYSDGKKEVEFRYFFDRNETEQIKSQIERILSRLLSAAPVGVTSTSWEKCRWIHDYLIRHVTYDEHTPAMPGHPETVYNILGVFLKGKAVCAGITKAATLLGDKLGVDLPGIVGDARSSDGKMGGHAWNLVRVDQLYSHVDITWDLSCSKNSDLIRYDYFCVPDQDIRANHFYDGTPVCPVGSGLSYFEKNHRLFFNMAECEGFVDYCLRRNEKVMYFQCLPVGSPRILLSEVTDMIIRTAGKYYKCGYHLTYSHDSSMNVFCYVLNTAA